LIDILDRMLGQLVDALWIAAQGRAIGHMARDAAIGHDPCNRSDRVGAPAETDQEDPITFLIQGDDSGVAIDNVPSDPQARRHAGEIVQPSHPANLEMTAIRRRTETGIVEGDLFGWFDLRVRADAAGAVELVNVCPRFVEIDAAGLTCAVGKDHNVLRHSHHPPKVRKKPIYHRLRKPNCELAHLRTARPDQGSESTDRELRLNAAVLVRPLSNRGA